MEAYIRVEKQEDTLPQNEIRVRRGVGIGRYLKRAWELLNSEEGGNKNDTVVIKGVSNAVQSAVNLAELIKHRVKGLHQVNKISNITIVDEFMPRYEGLDKLQFSRVVTMLQITLTTNEANVNKNDIGYQAPIPESEVQEYNERERIQGPEGGRRNGDRRRGGGRPEGAGGRGGRRGGRRGGLRNGGGPGPQNAEVGVRGGRNANNNGGRRNGPAAQEGGERAQTADNGEKRRNNRSRGPRNNEGGHSGPQGGAPSNRGGQRSGGERGGRRPDYAGERPKKQDGGAGKGGAEGQQRQNRPPRGEGAGRGGANGPKKTQAAEPKE